MERVAAKIRKEIDERAFAMYILRFQLKLNKLGLSVEYLLWNVVPDCVVVHVRNLKARTVELRLMSFRRRLHRGAVL